MADSDRKARIAAARKKLKQLQKINPATLSALEHNSELNSNSNDATPKNLSPSEEKSQQQLLHSMQQENHHQQQKNNPTSISSASTYSTTNINSHDGTGISGVQNVQTTFSPTESTEKLYSLSRQVTGLVNKSSAYLNGEVEGKETNTDDLEQRNQELASRLDKQTQAFNQLNIQLSELKLQNDKLQNSLESERKTFEEKLKKDLGALKEQLQVHIQTVGILVAEKTELQATCNQTQKISETRQTEIEELAGRLKASRQRVTDLEKNVTSLNSANQKLEKSNKEMSKELDKLKMDTYKNNKSREDLQQHNLELQGKLQQKIHDFTKLEDDVIELRSKLEMSELYAEQLKNGQDRPDSNVTKQIEKFLTEKTELQTKLQQQEESIKLLMRERENITTQYNQYIEQLQQQAKDLNHQVHLLDKQLTEEKLKNEEFESNLSQLKAKQAEVTDDQIHVHEEKSRLMETVESLMSQLVAASKNLEVQMADNSQLSRLVIEKEQTILELEQSIERINNSSVDQEKLLESIQSDKTALSRATSQNKELKTRFEELETRFITINEKNMEMMTRLQAEEHNNKELTQRSQKQLEEVKSLRHQIEEKSQQLTALDEEFTKLRLHHSNQISHNNQSDEGEERNRRMAELFQLKVPLIENLQKELSSAQDTINALTNQNSELRQRVIVLESSSNKKIGNDLSPDDHQDRSEVKYQSLQMTITQLEMEKDRLNDQLDESKKVQHMLKEKMDDIQRELATQVPATVNGDLVTKVHFEALQHAMKQLEEKYTRVMRDKAELIDRNERLEHIIMQLQGETDTIGEYVSLYHQQRQLMKQRTAEKDGYITQLSRERADMHNKFEQLQQLLIQLLREKHLQLNDSLDGEHGGGGYLKDVTNISLSPLSSPASDGGRGRKKKMRKDKTGSEGGDGGGVGNISEENSNKDEWPDYTDSSEEEEADDSQSKLSIQTVAEGPSSKSTPPSSPHHHHHHHSSTSSSSPPPSPYITTVNIPNDKTVEKIMNLLHEIGSTSASSPEFFKITFFCKNCTGDIHVI